MRIKFNKIEVPTLKTPENDAGYQKARYDEKNIYTNKPAWQLGRKNMKDDDKENRGGTKPVNVGPIFRMDVVHFQWIGN